MPQELHVVKCYSCSIYQVDIVKKSKKWSCKLCGEKQSLKQVFGKGTGKECREHVHRLNDLQKNSDNNSRSLIESVFNNSDLNEFSDEIQKNTNTAVSNILITNTLKPSKWEAFIEETNEEIKEESIEENLDTMNIEYIQNVINDTTVSSKEIKSNKEISQPKFFDWGKKDTSIKLSQLPNFHQSKNNPQTNKHKLPYVELQKTEKSLSNQLFNFDKTKRRKEIGEEATTQTSHQSNPIPKLQPERANDSLKVPKASNDSKWLNYINESNSNSDTESEYNEFVFL